MDPFWALDATAQASLVKRGEASSLELVDAAIARIDALDGPLNALTCRLFERARALAAAGPPDGPFEGVPFLVKDLAALEGAPLTFGSRFFADNVAKRSEPSVAASLAAGLVPLGKTNTPEFGLLGGTEPLLFGPTRNPWDLERSAGGSSGGAAAAVAAGMVAISGGGDGGGSIRIPASCCGLFGFKPSRARAIPPKRQAPGGLSVHLGLSRSVRDGARLFDISERRGAFADLAPIGFIDGPSTRRLRIALAPRSVVGALPEPEVQAALDDVAALCESLGHRVEEAEPPLDRSQAVERFLGFWAGVPNEVVRGLPLLRVLTWNWRSMETEFEPWTLGLAAWFKERRRKGEDVLETSRRFFDGVSAAYRKFFQSYDVVLSPVLRTLPAPIGFHAPDVPFETLLERMIDYVGYTPVYNAIGAPAMSVPLSMSDCGMPIGAHFAADVGQDELLFRLAYELEAARPWAGLWPPHSVPHLVS